MNAIPFDTLKMARKLEAGGFPGTQAAAAAEAMAEAMSGAELATKSDLMAVKGELLGVTTGLQHEIDMLRTDMMREIGLVRTEMAREIGQLRTDMANEFRLVRTDTARDTGLVRTEVEILRRNMTIRLGAMMVVSTGILLAAMRLMPMHF